MVIEVVFDYLILFLVLYCKVLLFFSEILLIFKYDFFLIILGFFGSD